MTGGLPLAMGVCWWSYAQYMIIRKKLSRFQGFMNRLLIGALATFTLT